MAERLLSKETVVLLKLGLKQVDKDQISTTERL